MDLGKLKTLQTKRKCVDCGMEFTSDSEMTAMQKHVDHMGVHQPTPEQWANAYNIIDAQRTRAK